MLVFAVNLKIILFLSCPIVINLAMMRVLSTSIKTMRMCAFGITFKRRHFA